MLPETHSAPAAVYLVAENLDAALAAGEDLLKATLAWHAGNSRSAEEIVAKRAEERHALETIRTLELTLVARVLKSRERSEELERCDANLRPVAKLFCAGTVILVEAVGELGDATQHDFDTGDGITAYLRSRGLIGTEAAAPPEAEVLAVTEDFRIAERIPLGALLNLVASFLDLIEFHYDIFAESEERAQRPKTLAEALAELRI
jgi:hypothetical protein